MISQQTHFFMAMFHWGKWLANTMKHRTAISLEWEQNYIWRFKDNNSHLIFCNVKLTTSLYFSLLLKWRQYTLNLIHRMCEDQMCICTYPHLVHEDSWVLGTCHVMITLSLTLVSSLSLLSYIDSRLIHIFHNFKVFTISRYLKDASWLIHTTSLTLNMFPTLCMCMSEPLSSSMFNVLQSFLSAHNQCLN